MRNIKSTSDELIYRAAQLFLDNLPVAAIRRVLNQEFSTAIERPDVYRLVAEARHRNFIRLVPPLSEELARQICDRFKLQIGSVRVVKTTGPKDNEQAAIVAAEIVWEIIQELARSRPRVSVKADSRLQRPISLGLGPGRATLEFSRKLSEILEINAALVDLKLVSITAGCPARFPEYAPISFFNLFPRHIVESRIGLFAESVVRAKEFAGLVSRPGVKEAFGAKGDIDIVVTSMGDFSDEHDLLRLFLSETGQSPEIWKDRGYIGDIQYRPYTSNGPVHEAEDEFRAVTLFELEELAHLATQRDRHVILIARQCGLCGQTRGRALLPILKSKGNLRVFSMLVVDVPSALQLLQLDS